MIQRGTIKAIGAVMQAAVAPAALRLYAHRATPELRLCTYQFQPNEPCPCGSGKKFKRCCQYNGRVYMCEINQKKAEKLVLEAIGVKP
jgi:hypothetical protein